MSRANIAVSVTTEERAEFSEWAKQRGQSQSEAMREIITAASGITFVVRPASTTPEGIAARFMAKQTNPEVRRALLAALLAEEAA